MLYGNYSLPVSVKQGDTLDILVENVGKVFYEPGLDPNQKVSFVSKVLIIVETVTPHPHLPHNLQDLEF